MIQNDVAENENASNIWNYVKKLTETPTKTSKAILNPEELNNIYARHEKDATQRYHAVIERGQRTAEHSEVCVRL